MTLRGLDDAAALATRLTPGHRLVVIGGGFIGLEVAASARKLGCDVVLIEGAPRLMGRAVPEPLAERALALHRARGVQVILDARLQSIKPLARGVAVALADGTSVEADTVLVGVGIEPATELAQAAGLTVQRGVVVNAHLQTSAPGVYAAGDVVEFPSALSGQLIRQETWHNAETQARIAAVNMQGGEQAYLALPWFWSDQYDYQLQVAGEPALAVTSVMRVLQEDDLIVFYLDDAGRLVGACGWGLSSRMARELKIARTLVERAVPVAADVLADPASKLKALLSQHQAPIAS
jgi:3-phenylpropionate/trans-cinnamate dioxygenase ferredoxin reductase subunit